MVRKAIRRCVKALSPCLVVLALSSSAAAAHAQWVVHAMGGTVQAVLPAKKAMTLVTDDGTSGKFEFPETENVNVVFEKDVRSATMNADKFNGEGHHVIVFYFGNDLVRTAVAVEDLGTAPVVKETGTVVSFDKHSRTITMLTAEGKQEPFVVDDKTVVDTGEGVTSGKKLHVSKGDRLRLLAESENGHEEVMLVRTSGIDNAM